MTAMMQSPLSFIRRELLEQAFRWSSCAIKFAVINLEDHRLLLTKLNCISEAQALFFFTRYLVLHQPTYQYGQGIHQDSLVSSGAAIRNAIPDEQSFGIAIASATKILTRKGDKLGRDFSNYEDVLKVARYLSSGLSGFKISPDLSPKLLPAAAIFAKWAFRLGHPDAKELLYQLSARSGDATYFLARIMQKTEGCDNNQMHIMYKKVERSDCSSACKAKQRLIMLKWPKHVAALRIYLFFLKKRRQRQVPFKAKSLRDLNVVLCDAELKLPYSFCKLNCVAELQSYLN